MYDITLYNYEGDPRTINKILTDGVTINGRADISNITNPVVEMRVADWVKFNYVHIPALNRYYYIEHTRVCGAGVVEITCKVDVLKTYAANIVAARGVITESEHGDRLLSTYNGVHEVAPNFEQIDFTTSNFDENGTLIMVTLKGKV